MYETVEASILRQERARDSGLSTAGRVWD